MSHATEENLNSLSRETYKKFLCNLSTIFATLLGIVNKERE